MGRRKAPATVAVSEPEVKPWCLTQADLDATTDLEAAFGTTRCLPPITDIPEPFWSAYYDSRDNIYVRMVDALFVGNPLPNGEVTFNEGFTGNNLMNFISAHLRSFEPKHEHKIAGLAYMISIITTIKELPCPSEQENTTKP